MNGNNAYKMNMKIENYRYLLEQKKGQLTVVESTVKLLNQQMNKLSTRLDDVKEARQIIQVVAQETQKQLEYHISGLVSQALATVFDDPYELKLEFLLRRGKTEADLLFTRPELEGGIKPMRSAGFGAVNIASFALRVALWSLKRPRTRNLLIMDEPFDNLRGKGERDRAVTMVKELSEKLGLQIILISDLEAFQTQANSIFRVFKQNGVSMVGEN